MWRLVTTLYWDDEISGFGLRITAGGTRAFILNYRVDGKQRRYKIGRYPIYTAESARKKAIELLRGIAQGQDPLEEQKKRRDEPLMSHLAEAYIQEYASVKKRPRSIFNDESIINNHILPSLAGKRVSTVTRRDIERLHGSLKSTPYQANRTLALRSKMFTLAIDWQMRSDNPVRGIERYKEDRKEKCSRSRNYGNWTAHSTSIAIRKPQTLSGC
jgi:hypothetical protein